MKTSAPIVSSEHAGLIPAKPNKISAQECMRGFDAIANPKGKGPQNVVSVGINDMNSFGLLESLFKTNELTIRNIEQAARRDNVSAISVGEPRGVTLQ